MAWGSVKVFLTKFQSDVFLLSLTHTTCWPFTNSHLWPKQLGEWENKQWFCFTELRLRNVEVRLVERSDETKVAEMRVWLTSRHRRNVRRGRQTATSPSRRVSTRISALGSAPAENFLCWFHFVCFHFVYHLLWLHQVSSWGSVSLLTSFTSPTELVTDRCVRGLSRVRSTRWFFKSWRS